MKTAAKFFAGLVLIGLFSGPAAIAAGTSPPILIGGTVSETGRYKEPSTMCMKGVQLWVRQVNDRGGILGRPVKLVLYNDQSDAETTGRLYEKLATEDKADLLLSPYSTPLTLKASEVSEAQNNVMLAMAAAANSPWERGFRYLFQIYAPADRQFIGLLDMMAQHGKKSLCILYDGSSDFNIDVARGLRQWAGTFRLKVPFDRAYTDGKTELPDLLARVREEHPEGLVLSAYPPDAYEMLRLLKQMDYRPDVLAMPIVPAHPKFGETAGEMADLVFGPSQWEPIKRIPFPGTKAFVDAFKDFTGHLPSFHAASAYSGCQILEQAILTTNSLDHRKLRDYIAALDTVTVLGRFKVDPTGKQIGHNSFVIQWQKGKKEIVWPDKMKTGEVVFRTR